MWLTRELIESDAWQAQTRASRMVIDRLMIEHMSHAGTENGNLACLYSEFTDYGIHRELLPAALHLATQTGLIIVTQKGKAGAGTDRWPTRYALGWMPMRDGTAAANRWKGWTGPPKPYKPRLTPKIYITSTESRTGKNGANPSPPVRNPVPELVRNPVPEPVRNPVPGEMNFDEQFAALITYDGVDALPKELRQLIQLAEDINGATGRYRRAADCLRTTRLQDAQSQTS
jgi:hypothetical protein